MRSIGWGVLANADEPVFESISDRVSTELRQSIDTVLSAPEGEQASYFHKLKEYPPSASARSLKKYLERYNTLTEIPLDGFDDDKPNRHPVSICLIWRVATTPTISSASRIKNATRWSRAS